MHGVPWMMVPRNIPLMEETKEPIGQVIRKGGHEINEDLIPSSEKLVIPPNHQRVLLFDHSNLTIGYPVLSTDKGKDSRIKVIYSEALYPPDGSKGNRNVTQN